MNQSDHDLLIAISIGQQDLKTDVRAVSDTLNELERRQQLIERILFNELSTYDWDEHDFADLKLTVEKHRKLP